MPLYAFTVAKIRWNISLSDTVDMIILMSHLMQNAPSTTGFWIKPIMKWCVAEEDKINHQRPATFYSAEFTSHNEFNYQKKETRCTCTLILLLLPHCDIRDIPKAGNSFLAKIDLCNESDNDINDNDKIVHRCACILNFWFWWENDFLKKK